MICTYQLLHIKYQDSKCLFKLFIEYIGNKSFFTIPLANSNKRAGPNWLIKALHFKKICLIKKYEKF